MIFHITTVHKNIQLGSQLMPLRQLKVKKNNTRWKKYQVYLKFTFSLYFPPKIITSEVQ